MGNGLTVFKYEKSGDRFPVAARFANRDRNPQIDLNPILA